MEFQRRDIVHKPHPEYKKIFVPVRVTAFKEYFDGETQYELQSMDKDFPWICVSRANLIKESKSFGIFKSKLIDEEYQQWIEDLAKVEKD